MNKVVEHNPSLTADQKNKMKRFLIYRSNPSNPNDEPYYMSYYIGRTK
jgi:succinate dehydrogenase (ubiquinone) iron-sulfur subunit